jgi:hypothetical protein
MQGINTRTQRTQSKPMYAWKSSFEKPNDNMPLHAPDALTTVSETLHSMFPQLHDETYYKALDALPIAAFPDSKLTEDETMMMVNRGFLIEVDESEIKMSSPGQILKTGEPDKNRNRVCHDTVGGVGIHDRFQVFLLADPYVKSGREIFWRKNRKQVLHPDETPYGVFTLGLHRADYYDKDSEGGTERLLRNRH